MAGLIGMDVEEVRALAAFMRTSATELTTVRDRLTTAVGISTWKGRDAEQFTHRWNGQLRTQLTEVAEALRAAQEVLLRNADHQQLTSDTLDGPSAAGAGVPVPPKGSVFDFFGDVAEWTGDRIGDAVEWTGDRLRDGIEWTGDRIEDAVEWTGDRIQDGVDLANRVWDDLTARASAGWAGLQRWGGDVFNHVALPFRTLIEQGRFPYPMEVLASGTVVYASTVGTLANVLAGEDLHFFDDGRPVVGEAWVRPVSESSPPRDFLSLTQNTMNAYEGNDPDGLVRVTAIRNPGEPTRYVVAIPGTQGPDIGTVPAWGGDAVANDWHANVRLMAAGTSTYNQGVMEAIDKAIAADRAAHPGESGPPSVLLTGHSQGGFNAAYVAANAEFASRYDVQGVVNYAGPIDNAGVPSSIPVLSLVNGDLGRGDLVPTLDGGRMHVLNPLADQLGLPRPGPIHDLLSPTHVEQVRMPAHGPTWDLVANHGQQGYIDNVANMVSPGASGSVAADAARVQAWEQQHGLDRFYLQDGGQFTQLQVQVGRTVE